MPGISAMAGAALGRAMSTRPGRGIVGGTVAGAGYGLVSNDMSVLGGAVRGGILGGAALGGYGTYKRMRATRATRRFGNKQSQPFMKRLNRAGQKEFAGMSRLGRTSYNLVANTSRRAFKSIRGLWTT